MEQVSRVERKRAWEANVEVEKIENIKREIESLNPLTDQNREIKEMSLKNASRAESESNYGILLVFIGNIRDWLSVYETDSEQDKEIKTRALNIIESILEKNK